MKMRSMTITVQFEEKDIPKNLTLGAVALGGKVTAMAGYDLFHTSEIAESALNSCGCEKCTEAIEKMDRFICGN